MDRSNFEQHLKMFAESEANFQEFGWYAYQYEVSTFAVYPEANTGSLNAVTYNVLQLAAESGETCGKLAKHEFRKDPGSQSEFDRKVKKELGDILWSISQLCTEKGWDLSEIAMMNLHNLRDRKERGVLKGSGDDR